MKRYGRIRLERFGEDLVLTSDDKYLTSEIMANKKATKYITDSTNPLRLKIEKGSRGHIKHLLIKMGLPVEDLAGYSDGAYFHLMIKTVDGSGRHFHLRDYQKEAADIFYAGGTKKGGSGVIVLPFCRFFWRVFSCEAFIY